MTTDGVHPNLGTWLKPSWAIPRNGAGVQEANYETTEPYPAIDTNRRLLTSTVPSGSSHSAPKQGTNCPSLADR